LHAGTLQGRETKVKIQASNKYFTAEHLTECSEGLISQCNLIRLSIMPDKKIIKPAKSAPAVGPYNHAVRIGDLLFCAGQIPIDPATGNLVSGDIKAQTERVLQNVKAILDDQNLTFSNVVKSTVFMTNLADFAAMNEVYAKYFTSDYPARSTVQVAALPKGANVEIEVVAHF
jgi:2-iminobutanoate/2-iminopropanoate deaminase